MAKSMLQYVVAIAVVVTAHSVQAGPVAGQGTWETTLQQRDLDGNGVTDAYYDTALGITWLQNANYAATELDNARRDAIILEVGSVNGHALTREDFQGWVLTVPYDGNMTWWGATAWAQALVFGGYSDWRLPTMPLVDPTCSQQISHLPLSQGTDCRGGEMGHLYYVGLGGTYEDDKQGTQSAGDAAFFNIQANYVSGDALFDGTSPGDFLFSNGWHSYTLPGFPNYAWAVRDGDVTATPLPEPTSLWLLVTAMAAASLVRRQTTALKHD